jgi:hypothetical protein
MTIDNELKRHLDKHISDVIRKKNILDLVACDYSNLEHHWTALLTCSDEFKDIYDKYNALDQIGKQNKYSIIKSITYYEEILNFTSIFNAAVHNKHNDEKQKEKKKEFNNLVAYSQIHISRLQHQYNQLVYWKQHKEFRFSLLTAIITALVSFIISILSIFFTIYYGEISIKGVNNTFEHDSNAQYINNDETMIEY